MSVSDSPTPGRPRPSAWTLAGLAALAVLLAVVWQRRAEVAIAVDGLAVAVLAAVVGLFAAANLALAENWYRLSLTGTSMARRPDSWRVFAMSQPLRYLLPGGHLAARGALARREGLTLRAGVGLGVLDLVLSLCVLSLLSLLTAPAWLPATASTTIDLLSRLAVVPAAVAVALLVSPRRLGAVLDRLVRAAIGRTSQLPAAAVLRAQLLRYLGSVVMRGLGFVGLVVALSGDGPQVPVAPWPAVAGAALGAFAVGNLAGRLAPLAPAGLGVRDITIAAILTGPLGLGTATAVALLARMLDLLGELTFLASILLVTSGRSTVLRSGQTLFLDDGSAVRIETVEQRTWSNLAVGHLGTRRVVCKQSLDRRGRPDPQASTAQTRAYHAAAHCGLRVPTLVGTAAPQAIAVREWLALQPPADQASAAIAVLDQVAHASGGAPGLTITDVFVDGATPDGVGDRVTLTVVDPDDAHSTAAGCRSRLIASLVLANWGRPLRAFVRGPDWDAAARAWQATHPSDSTEERAAREDVRATAMALIAAKRAEWVGVTPLQALTRFLGVHTVGRRYARLVDRGLRDGRLDQPPVSDLGTDQATRARYQDAGAARRYDQQARGSIGRMITAGERHASRRALRQLSGPVSPEGFWLDVAGGSGRLADAVGLPLGSRVSLDRSSAMLARDTSGTPALVADAVALPFGNDSVATAVVMRLVHRTSDPVFEQVMTEALRVSRGGVVLSYTRPTPRWRHELRRLLGRGAVRGGRSAAQAARLVAAAGGVVRADIAVLPVVSAERVLAVSRPAVSRDAMIGASHSDQKARPRDRQSEPRPDPRGVARTN